MTDLLKFCFRLSCIDKQLKVIVTSRLQKTLTTRNFENKQQFNKQIEPVLEVLRI